MDDLVLGLSLSKRGIVLGMGFHGLSLESLVQEVNYSNGQLFGRRKGQNCTGAIKGLIIGIIQFRLLVFEPLRPNLSLLYK